MPDGEKANWRGELFNSSCNLLVKAIGYKEIVSGLRGIDMLAVPPEGYPTSTLMRPFCSPNGPTAFEFTSQGHVGANDLSELSKKVNNINKNTHYKAEGGVIVCDIRLPDTIFEETSNYRGFYIWDIRDASLFSTKVLIRNLASPARYPVEKALYEGSTYLFYFLEASGKSNKCKVDLFLQWQTAEVTSQEIDKAIGQLTSHLSKELGSLGLMPVEIALTIHIRSYHTRDVYNKMDEILGKHSAEGSIRYYLPKIVSYYHGPWEGLLFQSL